MGHGATSAPSASSARHGSDDAEAAFDVAKPGNNLSCIMVLMQSKLFDIFVPLLTWFLITLPVWLSPFHPALVAYFIIAFNLYFFYKAIKTAYYSVFSYQMIAVNAGVSYVRKVASLKETKDIHHFVIIPNYKEPLNKLTETIEALKNASYSNIHIYLMLAFEEREEEAQEKARILTAKFKKHFKEIMVSYHRMEVGEVVGKASNQTCAAKLVDDFVVKKSLQRENVLITICDADSIVPKNYFAYLTYRFIKDPGRMHHFYWAPVLLYNNFWKLPFFVRMQATMSSIIRLSILPQRSKLIQLSTYSTNLWLLKELNFWDVDIIPEDWHIFLQAFFTFGKKVETIPLYTIISGDAVYSGGIIKTFKNRYEQERRWAWGVSDASYALKRFFQAPWNDTNAKVRKLLFIMETHLLWPTSFFILTLSAFIPPLIHPSFKRTVLGFLLPKLTSFILTMSSLTIVLYVYLDIKLRQKISSKTEIKRLPFLFIQWYMLPVVSFVLSSLPALDAHTRIILGKKLDYKVTEKV